MAELNGVVTDEVAEQYHRDGFAIVRELVNGSDLVHLRVMFDQLNVMQDRPVIKFSNRLVLTSNLWQTSNSIKALVFRLGQTAARLMDVDRVRLVDDVAFVKPPRQEGGESTIWHQDSSNYPFDRRGFLTLWIAINDIPLEQGPLTFVPGSHRIGLLGAVDGGGEDIDLDSFLKPWDYAHVGPPVATALRAGDASVHDGYMLHSAGPNLTPQPRLAWGVRFIPASTLYTGGPHRTFDKLGLKPFEPFEHEAFPLIASS
jgi:ectoine hydroxylase-related dioxygenase (phytanoyl-CoA dioxygenase family)